MFLVHEDCGITPHTNTPGADDPAGTDATAAFSSQRGLSDLLQVSPGSYAVRLWNRLPGVTPIHTPPGEASAKFRNKATAVERIWSKLCELYPDAVNSEDMPKVKERNGKRVKGATSQDQIKARTKKPKAESAARNNHATNGRKSAWAEELKAELRKRFEPGQDFSLEDVYKLIPGFQRRHKENHHIAARLRTTLAQDLRGAGVVKSLKRGQYRMA